MYTNAVSPIILNENLENLPKAIIDNPLLFIDKTVLNKSEFIQPLSAFSQQQYENLWKEIREVNSH